MTVESLNIFSGIAGDGVTSVFPFSFPVQETADVLVTYFVGTQYSDVSPGGYTVTLNPGDPSIGGVVTFLPGGSPPPVGTTVLVRRYVQPIQGTSIQVQDGFDPTLVTDEFDKLTMVDQQLTDAAARSIAVPYDDPSQGSMMLPIPAVRASHALGFDANGALALLSVTPFYAPPPPSTTPLFLTDFGADPTGAAHCDLEFAQFVAAVMATGKPGIIPPGRYTFSEPAVIDYGAALAANGAAKFSGVLNRSILDFTTAVQQSPQLLLTDTAGNLACFYGVFEDITVRGNCAGPVMQIGNTAYTDAFNEFVFKVAATNASISALACALRINGVYNCKFFIVANCSGYGDACRISNAQFCEFFGSFGNADVALHIADYYSYGNVFMALDLEVCDTSLLIDSVDAINNTFIGGQWNYGSGKGVAGHGVNAVAGTNNLLINPNQASPLDFVGGSVGLVIYGQPTQTMQTFAGVIVSPSIATDGVIATDSKAGFTAYYQLRYNTKPVWSLQRDNSAPTGGNAGLDFLFTSYDDNGNVIGNPWSVTRSTGVMLIQNLIAAQAGGKLGFYGSAPTAKQSVTGSRSSGAALASLINALSTLGLITDGSSA